MEPANILFVIAFIGLPIAFGIWALFSRRELLRSRPPRQPQQPSGQQEPAPRRRRRRRPPPPQRQDDQTRQLPAAHPEQQTRQAPAQALEQHTMQMPAAREQAPPPPARPPVPAPEPAPEPEERWSGSSGTTEEFPIVGYPEWSEPQPDVQETAAMPAQKPPTLASPAPAMQQSRPTGPPLRRPFYPPRFQGRSGGVVKRLTPLNAQRFIRPREE